MQDAWNEAASEVLQENTAQAIQQQLEQLDNQKDRYSRRWIWELFQNALDATPEGQPARVQIRHQDNKFTFSHNGAPFHQKEILHLIFHGSTKREREGVIGRYGTGFLTTHVLSKTVRICGSLTTSEEFNFVLDRTGATPSEIAKAMASSFENLRDSIIRHQGGPDHLTTFEYHLDDAATDLVGVALNDLRVIAPFVLAFNPAIGSIEIDVGGARSLAILARHNEALFGTAHLVEVGDMKDGQIELRCCVIEGADLAIAIPLGGSAMPQTVAIPETLPRLFVAFPLFGTERLPLPFVLNCAGKPTEKRDGLFLSHEDTDDNRQNKQYVERGWELFAGILQNAAALHWENLFQLARVGPAPTQEWLDTEWFDKLTKLNLAKYITAAPLVRTGADTVSPRNAIFPLPPDGTSSDDFVELVQPVYGGSAVPRREVAAAWADVLSGWADLTPLGDNEITVVRLVDLGRRVSSFKTLDAIEHALQAENAVLGPIPWLNRFLGAVFISGDQTILDKERVLPDQNGTLQLRSQLKRDLNVDERLKVISRDLGGDIRAELMDLRLDQSAQDLLPTLTSDSVSMALLTQIISKAKTEYNTADYRRANTALFAWFASQRRLDALKSFPFIGTETDQSGNERLAAGGEQLLAPVDVWPETARRFVDLFPAAYVASTIYAGAVNRETWEWLEGQHSFLLDPITRHAQDVNGDDLAGLLEQPFQREQEDLEHKILGLQVVDLVHLNLKDKGIIDSVRTSKTKAARFLEFIVRHLLPNTTDSLNYEAKECICSSVHSVHSAMWISTLKNRQWVYERKGHAGKPTAANLAKIWKDDSELMASIAQTEVILFLRRLEINASEIQRSASPMPEADSVKMEKAMVALLAATKSDVSRLQRLAEIASADPDFLDEYEKRLKQRERVRLNQRIGTSTEILFKSIFNDPKLLDLGLRITRTGWGSDFCIENDFVDESGEVAFELRSVHGASFLVELKSTFGPTISMSERQGNEAVKGRGSFGLCVVPLQSEVISLETLRKTARFVPDIGRLLKDSVVDLKTLRDFEMQAAFSGNDVEVLIQGSEVLYKVKEPVWIGGLDFEDFINFLLRFFGVSS